MRRPHVLIGLLAVTLLATGCGSNVAPASANVPPASSPDRPITLSVRLGSCIATIECRVRGSLTPYAMPAFGMVNLIGWPEAETKALPSTLKPGRYTARFAFVMPTDDIQNGDPWQSIAECESEIVATGNDLALAIELVLRFDDSGCVVTQYGSAADS